MLFSVPSVFPDVLAFAFLATAILRGTIGLIWINIGRRTLKRGQNKVFSFIQILGGILIFIGLWTQVLAIILGVSGIYMWGHKNKETEITDIDSDFFALLTVATLVLIFLGSGALAFDIPV